MDEARQIIEILKRTLKMRGYTYRSLGKRINLSEASVKRIFAQRTFSLKRLEQVCRAVDMSIAELVKMVDRKGYATTALTLSQEAALAKDEALLSYFYLLLNGWTDIQIRRNYQFEELQTQALRARLADLELIEARPKRGYRLLVSRQITWRPDGPVRHAYEQRVQQEFLRSTFSGSRDYLAWQPVELTDSSIDVLRRKFAQIYREFMEMAELDQHSSQPRHSVGLLLAFRPWVFSLVAARQRRGLSASRL
jgi:transcriptional regulator with XRE-family HTH domain